MPEIRDNGAAVFEMRHALAISGKEGLEPDSMVISRIRFQALEKRVEVLERALGRKSLEVDI